MASERDLLMNEVHEKEYLEIDAKVKFHSVVSCIIKWQMASSDVSDEVYESNKEQYIMEAETLQSKLTEAYFRLENSTVYKLSSPEKKKREVLMEELSYEINYLSDVTPIETDCNQTAVPAQCTEQVDTDQLSTALQNIHVEHTDKKLTDQDCEHVEPTITEVENADVTCKGYATADTEHTVRVTNELGSCTEEPDVHKKETAVHTIERDVHVEEHTLNTEEPDDHKEEPAVDIEKPDDHKVEIAGGCTEEQADGCTEELVDCCTEELPDGCTEEHAAFRKEPAAYTEYTEQPPRARKTAKTSTSTNSQFTGMQTQVMNEHASTDSNIAEDRDIDIKVWHNPQITVETIKTPQSMSIVATCCHSDYSNEIRYLLLYS